MALPWVRSSALALVALLTGLGGHLASGGAGPSVPRLGVLLVVATVLVRPLLTHQATTRRVVVLVCAGESLVHLGLAGWHTGHVHASTAPPSWASAHALSGESLLMLEAHLLAAAVVGVWLAAGERALWRLVAATLRPLADAVAARVALSLVPQPLPTTPRRPVAGGGQAWSPPARWMLTVPGCARRGPPVTRAPFLAA